MSVVCRSSVNFRFFGPPDGPRTVPGREWIRWRHGHDLIQRSRRVPAGFFTDNPCVRYGRNELRCTPIGSPVDLRYMCHRIQGRQLSGRRKPQKSFHGCSRSSDSKTDLPVLHTFLMLLAVIPYSDNPELCENVADYMHFKGEYDAAEGHLVRCFEICERAGSVIHSLLLDV